MQEKDRKEKDRKYGEEEIRLSSAILATQQEASPDGILTVDESGNIISFNKRFTEIWNIPPDLIASREDEPVLQHVVGQVEDATAFLSRVRYLYDHKEERSSEEIRLRDGRVLERFSSPVMGEDNRYFGRVWFFHDISERKRTEASLRESEERFRGITDRISDLIFIVDPEGYPTFMSPSVTSILGFPPEYFIGKRAGPDIIHSEDMVKIGQAMESLKNGSPEEHVEFRMLKRDGSFAVFEGTGNAVFSHGMYSGVQVVARDVTGRKRAEEALRQSEKKYRTLFENMLEGFAYCRMIYDEAGRPVDWVYLDVNKAFGQLTGLDNITGKPVLEAIPDIREQTPGLFDTYGRVASTGMPETFEIDFKPLKMWLKVSVFSPEKGYFVAVFENVTERKQAEAALRESRQILEGILNTIPVRVFWKDKNLTFLGCNTPFARDAGFEKPEDIIGRDDYSMGWREQAERYRADDRAVIESGKPKIMIEEPQTTPAGETRYLLTSKMPLLDARGDPIGILGTYLDITGRKRAEEAMSRSEERYRTLAEASPDQIFINDRNGTILYANTMGLKLFGLPYDQVVGKQRKDLFPPELLLDQDAIFEEVFISGEPVRKEARIRFGEQEQWIDTNLVPLKDTAGQVTAVLGVARDITVRRQMEEALRESRQLFSDIISFLPDPTFVIDKEGKVLAWNRALEQLSGVPSGDIIGKGDHEYSLWLYGKRRPILIDLVLHPDQDAGRMDYTDISPAGHTIAAQAEIIPHGSGRRVHLSLVASPLFDTDGKITGAIESMRDISPLKEAEAELACFNTNLETIIQERTQALQDEIVQRRNAEENVQAALRYNRSVIEANPDLMVVLDRKGTILDVNAAGESLTGVPREQLIGSLYSLYLTDDSTPPDVFARLLEKGRVEYTVQLRRADGHVTPLSVNTTLFRGKDTTGTRIIVAAHDITRQKNDEAVIRAALDEQVLLLREVHHRVNNNLQIIISLTNLQMRQTDDPGVKQILSEMQNRVRAMSLVHEKLYRSESLSHIDFADYTRFLATRLFSFYGMDTRNVTMEFSLSKIVVDIVTAVPLGLLMNELISNALRHAFPQGRQGTISISGRDDGSVITLVVRDNGIGMPEDFDWKNTRSLGMRLIVSLADQVDGTLTLDRQNGTTFTLAIRQKRDSSPA